MVGVFSGIIERHIHSPDQKGGVTAVTIGFERNQWRCQIFTQVLFREFLIEFALPYSEAIAEKEQADSIARMSKAAAMVYSQQSVANRGEFGELILHAFIRTFFRTEPAISKIYFKDSANDTVKGFDAVHVVVDAENIELWLGEAKFYTDINVAIRDVVEELNKHTQTTYLRDEFIAITNKIDSSWPHADKLKLLLDEKTSLDEIFSKICIPVLLTYDSGTMRSYQELAGQFNEQLQREISKYNRNFWEKALPSELKIHLILFPMVSKEELVTSMDTRLWAWQTV